MGTLYAACEVQNVVERQRATVVPRLLVDTGSEFTWIPEREEIGIQREKKDQAFARTNGQQITRSVGFAILRVEGNFTINEVVFADSVDLLLLGSRTLDGLNLRVDAARKRLIAAGAIPAATVVPLQR